MAKHHTFLPLAGVLGALVLAPSALAGQPPRSDLNPPPPDDYVCQATGPQTICRTQRQFHNDPAPTGVFCPTFEISDQDDVSEDLMRRYDANGTSSSVSSASAGSTRCGATRPRAAPCRTRSAASRTTSQPCPAT